MNKPEAIAGALVVAVGAALLVAASRFPFLLSGIPGPGFLPLFISFGILGAGVVLLINACRASQSPAKSIAWATASGWKRVAQMLLAMAASFWLLDTLGFVAVTVVFMAVMLWALGERSWSIFATVPLLSAIGLYVVFAVWLRVPLPKGIINFLG